MAGFNILKWLYKHSPVNFYSSTEHGETVIKSINNIFLGYKFNYIFSEDKINKLRKVIKHFKRFSAILILLLYFIAIYGLLFNHYEIFVSITSKVLLLVSVLCITFLILFISSRIFEWYLRKNYGEFDKVKFPVSDVIEHQSYKDFKLELVKISALVLLVLFVYFSKIYLFFGSPYETSLKLISSHKYEDAIKVTSLWAKFMPMDSQWYSMRGYARFYTKDYKGAIEDFGKAYNLEDDEFKSMNFDNKIYVRYYLKEYDKAISDFDKEINKNTDDRNSFVWDKAQFLYNIGKYQEALDLYNTLIEESITDRIYLFTGRLYFERAQVLKKLRQYDKAKQDLKMAEELNLVTDFQNSIPQPVLLLNGI